MLVSDVYKVIDDDVAFAIEYYDGILSERVMGSDWSVIPQHVLDWPVRRIYVGNQKIFIDCR